MLAILEWSSVCNVFEDAVEHLVRQVFAHRGDRKKHSDECGRKEQKEHFRVTLRACECAQARKIYRIYAEVRYEIGILTYKTADTGEIDPVIGIL